MNVLSPSQVFHLAFPVNDLASTRRFYCELLGCAEGRSAARWVDFDFFGNQISAHLVDDTDPRRPSNEVEDKEIPVPHFGAILPTDEYSALESRLVASGVNFIHPPFTRFEGQPGEQRSMFLEDPSGNVLEFKSFVDSIEMFRK